MIFVHDSLPNSYELKKRKNKNSNGNNGTAFIPFMLFREIFSAPNVNSIKRNEGAIKKCYLFMYGK
jgi:hypothetical protein